MSKENMVIVADSCCDLNEEIKNETGTIIVPLNIIVEEKEYRDDEHIDLPTMMEHIKRSIKGAQSTCPSPQEFIDAFNKFKDASSIFVVTLSKKLSGSYNSAMVAKDLFLSECKNKFVHVFDSFSASCGETLISLKINECIKQNLPDYDIVKKVEEYIQSMRTFFIIDDFNNLVKNGRMSKAKALIANLFKIVPIMKGEEGEIAVSEKIRGKQHSMTRLVEMMAEQGLELSERILAIAHCNALDLANKIKEMVLEKGYQFKDIIIVNTAGISSMYAQERGIIVAY